TVQIISTGSYVVNLNVDDTDIGRLKVGQSATVTRSSAAAGANPGRGQGAPGAAPTTATVPASPAPTARASAAATVTSVGAIATSTSGVASFPVVLTIDVAPADFFAGAAVQASITYNELADVITVPSLAVTQADGQASVTVVDGTRRTRRVVTTGLVSGGQTQITEGLAAGQQVLVTVPAAAGRGGGANPTARGGFGGGGGGPGGGGFVPPPGAVEAGPRP
ncbi:MAG: hypothetical protein ABIS47_10485, partial [Acidimicrobiales bacterium]